MFKSRYRHIRRYREIVNTLAKHGFGFLIDKTKVFDLFDKKKGASNIERSSLSRGQRIRQVCEQLGPTFIKLGQIASTRHDVIPEDIIRELEHLQDNVPAFSYHQVKEILEEEYGKPIDMVFAHFEQTPIATASIGQVHQAKLHSGKIVAVKVQRPDIFNVIETDLEILFDIARVSENRTDWGKQYHLCDLVEEFAFSIRNEMNYLQEARNTERIQNNLKEAYFSSIQIPNIYWEYTTKKVLVLEYFAGEKLTQNNNGLVETQTTSYDKNEVATEIIEVMFHMILHDGIFHADPHPGNILILPNRNIGLLDFGMVGKLSDSLQKNFINIIIGLMRRNTGMIIKAIHEIGIIPNNVDSKRLHHDVEQLRNKYYEVPFSEISLGQAIKDLFAVTRKHKILIPSDFLLLAKALITLEGLVETLAPNLSIIGIAEPMGKRYLQAQYSPENVLKHVFDETIEFGENVFALPKLTKELLQKTKDGNMNIQITIPKLEVFLRKLDTISNRLSFSIIMLSFSIIMVGLIVGSSLNRRETLLWEIPAIEGGFIIAAFMFLWLLISIFRSGRF